VRLLAYVLAARRNSAAGRARWLLLAPAAGVLALALITADVRLQVRWNVSRSAFEDVVDEAMRDEDYASLQHGRLGLYRVGEVYRQGEAVIFYERTGALGDDAGFAYLPDGPFPELENGGFERPRFRHLGGPWYAWTASW
jgi:hypothetical protein